MGKTRHNDRRCVSTGDPLSPDALAIRFVLSPDGELFPDLSEKLPGRGAWISADREALLLALKKGAFAKSLRTAIKLPQGVTAESFADQIEGQLHSRILSSLGLCRKAGQLIAGFDRVRENRAKLVAYVTPCDAAEDGVGKITKALEASGRVPHIKLQADSETLSHAIGEIGVVHIGLLAGKAATATMIEVQRWQSFCQESARLSA